MQPPRGTWAVTGDWLIQCLCASVVYPVDHANDMSLRSQTFITLSSCSPLSAARTSWDQAGSAVRHKGCCSCGVFNFAPCTWSEWARQGARHPGGWPTRPSQALRGLCMLSISIRDSAASGAALPGQASQPAMNAAGAEEGSRGHLVDVGACKALDEEVAHQAGVPLRQRPRVPQDEVAVQAQVPRRHRRCPAAT